MDETNTLPPLGQGDETRPSRRRIARPTVAELIESLSLMLAVTSTSVSANKVHSLLRRGIQGEYGKEETSRVSESLLSWPDHRLVLLRIASDVAQGRARGFLEAVFNRSQSVVRQRASFPFPTGEFPGYEERFRQIEEWVFERAKADQFSPDGIRDALICLVSSPVTHDAFMITNELIKLSVEGNDRLQSNSRRKNKKSKYGGYVAAALRLFADPRVSRKKAIRVLTWIGPFEQNLSQLDRDIRQAVRESDKLKEELRSVGATFKSVQVELEEARLLINQLRKESDELVKHLESEKEKVRALDGHWAAELRRSTSGQAHQISEFVLHEIEEVRKGLSGDAEAKQLAIGRIRRIIEYFDNLRASNA